MEGFFFLPFLISLTDQAQVFWVTLDCCNKWQCHWLGDLNSKHLFLAVLEAEKSKTKVLADLVLGEGHLLIKSLHGREQKEQQVFHVSSCKDTWGLCPYDLITFQRPHVQMPSHWGFQHVNFMRIKMCSPWQYTFLLKSCNKYSSLFLPNTGLWI